MYRLTLLLCAALGVASPGWAATCVSGTLQDYIDLGGGGCTIGPVAFRDFMTAPGQTFATPINPALITVDPLFPLQFPGSPGFQLTLNRTASANQLFESFFQFSAAGLLTGSSIGLGPATANGDGSATATADLCVGGSFDSGAPINCTGTPDVLATALTATDSQLLDQRTFAPVNFLDVFVDLVVDGGQAGSATLGSATILVDTPIPEPSSIVLAVSGLCGLAFLRRRARQQ